MDKAIMLDKIKDYYSFKTDVDFAKFLGITPQVYSNWKSRNSFDAELLYNKCPELNPSWLLCGKEPMMSDEEKELQVNEAKSPYILRKKLAYLEDELRVLGQADKIMSESGSQIKKAIELLTNQLQLTEKELEDTLKEKK
ncbi:helix-turn-helix domain-containing protein [Aequorivita viscosa]|uniref:Bacteriophage CI repressor helix-turn-helix domain-containing protein n=1 Tax=Aequorivita viscosa TaxID=797419 RepID=A0A1M6P4B3_9FLAO|nr:helix-turn-helix domain-containing protein [Aequorivita viscosa]SDX51715.1 Bacteriophage CI repressor helix-turn-helix domain-containing protein [Aequorivita viscosa]SHK02815.1 Bacteriophage CI repressor helix-turn-helix domain-containing protein [Aequorivita viscosa]